MSKGSKDAKIKKMIDDLKCTRYEANHYYSLVMHVESARSERSSERATRRAFTMGVEIECFGFVKSEVREAWGTLRSDIVPAISGDNSHKKSETVQVYFDTEKNEWRCFKLLNLAAIY